MGSYCLAPPLSGRSTGSTSASPWVLMLGGAESLYDLIRPRQHRGRDRQPQRLRGLEVDHQLELGLLFDGEVGGLGAPEDLVHVHGGAPTQGRVVGALGHEPTFVREPLSQAIVGHRCFMASCAICEACVANIKSGST